MTAIIWYFSYIHYSDQTIRCYIPQLRLTDEAITEMKDNTLYCKRTPRI